MDNPHNTPFYGFDDQCKDNISSQQQGGLDAENILEEAKRFFKAHEVSKGNKSNPFPTAIFPEVIQLLIKDTNENLNYPIDFIGASILYASCLAIGNTHRVEVRKGWQESAVLFIANVGEPGSNKSHPLSFALQPIFDVQEKSHAEYEIKKKEYERVSSLTREERKKQELEEPVKPFWQKSILSDFTPEALNEVHKFNKRCAGVYADELGTWFKNFNRYHKGAEQEFWLSAWSTKQIIIDRKGGEPIFIPLPFIPVDGCIQPSLLIELGKDSRMHNGFIDRILFAYPDQIEKPYWSKNEISQLLIEKWKIIVTNLFKIELRLDEALNPKPQILNFTPEAFNKLFEWHKVNTNLCNASESAGVKGIYVKLENYAIRLALIMELLKWACEDRTELKIHSISIEAVEGALELAEYFRHTALKVNEKISSCSPLDRLPADKRNLYEALPDKFTTAEGLKIAQLKKVP